MAVSSKDSNIGILEDLKPNANKALETVDAALNEDLSEYRELTNICGPGDATNYFGVVRHFLKQESEGVAFIEQLWDYGEDSETNPFRKYGFESHQEVVGLVENLEDYVGNIDPNNEDPEYLEEVRKRAQRLYDSITESMRVV